MPTTLSPTRHDSYYDLETTGVLEKASFIKPSVLKQANKSEELDNHGTTTPPLPASNNSLQKSESQEQVRLILAPTINPCNGLSLAPYQPSNSLVDGCMLQLSSIKITEQDLQRKDVQLESSLPGTPTPRASLGNDSVMPLLSLPNSHSLPDALEPRMIESSIILGTEKTVLKEIAMSRSTDSISQDKFQSSPSKSMTEPFIQSAMSEPLELGMTFEGKMMATGITEEFKTLVMNEERTHENVLNEEEATPVMNEELRKEEGIIPSIIEAGKNPFLSSSAPLPPHTFPSPPTSTCITSASSIDVLFKASSSNSSGREFLPLPTVSEGDLVSSMDPNVLLPFFPLPKTPISKALSLQTHLRTPDQPRSSRQSTIRFLAVQSPGHFTSTPHKFSSTPRSSQLCGPVTFAYSSPRLMKLRGEGSVYHDANEASIDLGEDLSMDLDHFTSLRDEGSLILLDDEGEEGENIESQDVFVLDLECMPSIDTIEEWNSKNKELIQVLDTQIPSLYQINLLLYTLWKATLLPNLVPWNVLTDIGLGQIKVPSPSIQTCVNWLKFWQVLIHLENGQSLNWTERSTATKLLEALVGFQMTPCQPEVNCSTLFLTALLFPLRLHSSQFGFPQTPFCFLFSWSVPPGCRMSIPKPVQNHFSFPLVLTLPVIIGVDCGLLVQGTVTEDLLD